MYPEEGLGSSVQSASIMWEQIECLFENIRTVIKRSGSMCAIGINGDAMDSCMYEFFTGDMKVT